MLWCGKRAEQELIRGRGSGEKQPVLVHCLGAQPLVTDQGVEADGVLVLEHILRSPGLHGACRNSRSDRTEVSRERRLVCAATLSVNN